MPKKIFICYRREDAGMAGRIGDSLGGEFGHDRVFLDTDKLEPGRRFDSELLRTLNESDVLIMVIGQQWLDVLLEREQAGGIDFVLEEIKEALRLELRVIPVLVDGVSFPEESLLPDSIRPVARWQSHDVRNTSFRRDLEALIGSIHALRQNNGSGQRIAKFGLSAAALAIVGAGVTWMMLSSDADDVGGDGLATAVPSISGAPVQEVIEPELNPVSEPNSDAHADSIAEPGDSSPAAIFDSNETGLSQAPASVGKDKPTMAESKEKVAEEKPTKESVSSTVTLPDHGKNIEKVQPVGNEPFVQDPAVIVAAPDQWNLEDSVFPGEKFSLCGYDSFTASPIRDGEKLLVRSDDRSIPGQTYPRLRWQVPAGKPAELFAGCNAMFEYVSSAGGERIYIKKKGE